MISNRIFALQVMENPVCGLALSPLNRTFMASLQNHPLFCLIEMRGTMNFDIRTIVITVHVIAWINFCIMTLAWYNTKSLRGITGYWSVAHALYGMGTLLVVLRDIIPEALSVVVANMCLVAGQIAVQAGLARYMNKECCWRKFSFSLFAAYVPGLLLLTYIMPSVPLRVVLFCLVMGLLFAVNIKTLWPQESSLDAPRMFLVVVLGCGIAVFVARSVFAMQDVGFSDLMRADFYQSVSVIGMLLVYVSQSNALFWLVTYKLGIEIQHQALTDVLTNAGNRRALDELMERAVPVGEDSSIGIMMIDVDGFKEINDRLGHQAGDLYLMEFARAVKQTGDHLFRYGGDEFVVIAYNLELAELISKAEYIRQTVEKLVIPWTGQDIGTTVSIGVAMADYHIRNWDELARRADQALYDAKSKGRNRVGVEQDTHSTGMPGENDLTIA